MPVVHVIQRSSKDGYSSVCEEATARGNDTEPLLSAHQVCEIGRVGLTLRSAAAGEQRERAVRCTAVLDTEAAASFASTRHVGNAPSCCSMPNSSATAQSSTIRPWENRTTLIWVHFTCLPVGAIPRY